MHQDGFTISFLHFPLFSTALWDLANSRPSHSLVLSPHLIFGLRWLLPPFTIPCKMVLARPDERETRPYNCSLRLFTMVRRSSCCLIAYWILAQTSSLVTWLSHAKDHSKQIEATSGEDHRWRTGRLQSRKEYHRADLQPTHSM